MDFFRLLKLNKIIPSLKYPLVRQYDIADCGPAALLSVLKYYGGSLNFPYLRELCNTNSQGSTMLDLVEAAEKIGLKAEGAKGEYSDLLNEAIPCIAHVISDNVRQHFVVVYKIKLSSIYLADPGKGRYWLSKAEFLKIWETRSVILLSQKNKIAASGTLSWYSWIFEYLKKESSWIYQSIFLGSIYTLIGLLTALFVQWIIDRFIPGRNTNNIVYTGICMLSLLLLKALTGYFRQKFLVVFNNHVNININSDFLSHLFMLPKKFFDTRKKGDITARIHDAIRIQRAIIKLTSTTIIDAMIVLGSIIFLFLFSQTLALIALITIPLYAVILGVSSLKIKKEQYEVMNSFASVESTYIDSLEGIDDIIGFRTYSAFASINKAFFQNFQEKVQDLGLTQALLGFLSELSGAVISLSILTIGALLVINNKILLGEMMAAYSLIAYMLPAVDRTIEANISLRGADIAARRLMDMLLVTKEENSGKIKFKLTDNIRLINAEYFWQRNNILLNGANFVLKRGFITTIFGPSGSGKTTIVNILQRKYPLNRGNIIVDEVECNNINLESYRRNMAVIPQHIKIFNGTILENITVGREIKSSSEISSLIGRCNLQHFFDRFPLGLFTKLGEDGRKLSGGERQIIALLRAIYSDPDVLIIDEGLSGIDIQFEEIVFRILRKYKEQHAVLIVTHNMKTIIEISDFIYSLKDGKIMREDIIDNPLAEFYNRAKMKII